MKSIKILTTVIAFLGITLPLHAYTVQVSPATTNCDVTWTPENPEPGQTVTVTIAPHNGYSLEEDGFEVYYECTYDEWWEANSNNAKPAHYAPRRKANGESNFEYRLEIWNLDENEDDPVEVEAGETYTFVMPERNVEIEALCIGNDIEYAITVTQKANGTTAVNPTTATAGTTVTITATPASDYVVDEVFAYEKIRTETMVFEDQLPYTKTSATTYTFTMPANDVRVEVTYKAAPSDLILYDNADNSTTLADNKGKVVNVTLSGRTLYKNGSWNTLCLPFDIDDFTGTPLEGATVKRLVSSSFANGTLTLNFSDDMDNIEAGIPSIVKWNGGTNVTDPVFNNVNILNDLLDKETNAVTFCGIYKPYVIEGEDKTMLYLGGDNKLYYPNGAMTIGAFRAYFKLADGLIAGEPTTAGAKGISNFVLNFDGDATGIRSLTPDPSPKGEGSDYWFTLDGRRLTGMPTQKGIYINNGKKVVIK